MRFQAAIATDMPVQELFRLFGPIENYGGIYVTRGYASPERLKTLIGTAQSRSERRGCVEFGAHIIPVGTKPETDRKKYEVKGPLKVGLDYSRKGNPKYYENVPQPTSFYDRSGRYMTEEALRNPETMIVASNNFYPDGLREASIREYWQHVAPWIARGYDEMKLGGSVYIKSEHDIVIKQQADFESLNHGRAVEYHFAVGNQTKFVWMEINPGENFPWDDAKRAVLEIEESLNNHDTLGVISTSISFSGKGGFHVLGTLHASLDTIYAQEIMHELAETYISEKNDKRLTTEETDDPKAMSINADTLHEGGGLRVDYSLAYPTGLVCLPLERNEMKNFETFHATIDMALQRMGLITRAVQEELLPEELESFEKWLNIKKGKMTGGDIRAILGIYSRMAGEQDPEGADPVYGERKFFRLIQEISGRMDWSYDDVSKWVDALRWLSDMPQYQSSANGTGNGHSNGKPKEFPKVVVPFEDIADKVEPEIEQLPQTAIDFLLDLPGRVSPNEIQRYIKVMLGFEVPLEKVNDFIDRLKLMMGQPAAAPIEEAK